MFFNPFKFLIIFLLFVSTTNSQQLQWVLLSDGTSTDTPVARRDAALGFDQIFLILYGGRTQTGMPLQDTYSFNVLTGQWDTLTFPAPPSSRYGMATASSVNSGLFIFGGFGPPGSSPNYNPYLSFGAGQQGPNYNYATPPNFMQNPILMNNPDFVNNPNYNPMSGTGYNSPNNYNGDDDRADENSYPLADAWLLSYTSKTWQQTQTSQYARGFGSAVASPYTNDVPKVLYSMGKSHDTMYSIVESIGQGSAGLSQTGNTQATIIMYDLPSLSPAYPHARYGHSTALLTDNHLLLYGGCLSGYGKGGPCPSKDSWLLTIDSGNWERLGECPPTKTGAAMVTVPSFSICSPGGSAGIGPASEQPIAVLWSGRESNPSSILTYPSPRDEIAVFSLEKKEWFLKRAAPSPTDGSYPMQREGAAFVAGCFQGAPGMFIFGGRATADRRLLSDLWFLQVMPQDVLNAPETRGCIYPFSFYHLHGIFQFFAYGVIFPIGYLVGRHAGHLSVKRPLHIFLQLFGIALSICGFAFGIHAVRAPAWLHFRHPHAIIGIITFILTIFQFVLGLIGACFVKKHMITVKRFNEAGHKISQADVNTKAWSGDNAWRIIHRILGALVLALGLINISLGIFLAVLPLPVWVVWYVYMGILVIVLVLLEIIQCLRGSGARKGGSLKLAEKREDPKGTSQTSLKYSEDPTLHQPLAHRSMSRLPQTDLLTNDNHFYRNEDGIRTDDLTPLISNQNAHRQLRPGDVTAANILPNYNRPDEKQYPIMANKRSRPEESGDAGYYVGFSPEHEQPLPRSSTQQQSEHNLTRIRLQ